MRPALIAVVMGVSGAGKSTVGRALADRLDWTFYDADDLHSAAAVTKMARGEGLTDADRAPWLTRVRAVIARHLEAGTGAVVACSALKAAYRDALVQPDEPVQFLWLDVPAPVLRQRLARREGHFAGADLLGSQLRTLEPPVGMQTARLDGALPLRAVVAQAVDVLGSSRD